MQRYANYVVYTWKNRMFGKPNKTSHFLAYLGNLGGKIFMIRVLWSGVPENQDFVGSGKRFVPLFYVEEKILTRLPSIRREIKKENLSVIYDGDLLEKEYE